MKPLGSVYPKTSPELDARPGALEFVGSNKNYSCTALTFRHASIDYKILLLLLKSFFYNGERNLPNYASRLNIKILFQKQCKLN